MFEAYLQLSGLAEFVNTFKEMDGALEWLAKG
jgi:hypothetical protein